MPVPISSHINAAAPRGKEEIGLKCRYLSCPTPCSNTESRGTCPKTFQTERTGEAEWRSRGSSSDMLSSPVVWSGLRCLAPFYSSANQAWFHKDSSSEAHSSGHSGNYNILDCWVKTSWSCHFCSSFPVLMRASLHPFPFSLFAVHFFPSHLTLKKTPKDKKLFLFKLQERLLSNYLYKEVNSCFHLPVNFTMFLDTWWCPFFHGVHWHPSWGNLLLVWPHPWAVLALPIMRFSCSVVCCQPVLSQDSEVLFIFF